MVFSKQLLLSAAAGSVVFVSGCCCGMKNCPAKEPVSVKAALEDVKLVLPEKIYAVPGVETNIYFDNIVRVINPDNYVFEARSKKGRWDEKRWSFTPDDKDVGSFKLTINVIGNQGLLASKDVTVVVSPRNAGKDKKLSILLVGDSLTAGSRYAIRIMDLFKQTGNSNVKLVGSHAGGGRKSLLGGIVHEGYGGWTWRSFNTRWLKDDEISKLTKPIDIIYARSPFLAMKDGKLSHDIQGYFDSRNGGKAPDIITFLLGVNDVFSASDARIEKVINHIFKNMDTLLAEMRKAAPDAIIGVGLPTAGAATQDAFGKNYGSRHSRWQYKKNQHRLVERMLQKFAKSNPYNVQIVPIYLNLDCENNFPIANVPINAGNKRTVNRLNNGVHPSVDGYDQIGDTFFCWMKSALAAQDKSAGKK